MHTTNKKEMAIGRETFEVRTFFKTKGESLSDKMYRLMENDLRKDIDFPKQKKSGTENTFDYLESICYNEDTLLKNNRL